MVLELLQEWYLQNCDGDWEHTYGLSIETLDNPGWRVKIDLTGTYLEIKHFESIKIERSDNDWIHCWVKENKFNGAGGPKNLQEILSKFLEWSRLEEMLEDR